MLKTLNKYAPEQREQMVGMWCDYDGQTVILSGIGRGISDKYVTLIDPTSGAFTVRHSGVTPRWDLPRAWTPDGQPVPGEWEEGMSGFFVHEAQLSPNAGNHGWTHRRFVTEWEQVPNE